MYPGKTDDASASSSFPAWEGAYAAAVRGTDKNELFRLVEIAEAAMLSRRDCLRESSDRRAERRAIEKALRNLSVIKKERLQFPS
jgi:hypothetical protein